MNRNANRALVSSPSISLFSYANTLYNIFTASSGFEIVIFFFFDPKEPVERRGETSCPGDPKKRDESKTKPSGDRPYPVDAGRWWRRPIKPSSSFARRRVRNVTGPRVIGGFAERVVVARAYVTSALPPASDRNN